MSRKKHGMSNKKNINSFEYSKESSYSKEELIEVFEEAVYRAMKRVDEENKKGKVARDKENKKIKLRDKFMLIINAVFCPYRLNKKYATEEKMYERLLTATVSVGLEFIGNIIKVLGFILMIYSFYMLFCGFWVYFIYFLFAFFVICMGGVLIICGDEFNKETDSEKIYMFSASIIALVSCVTAIISLIL